MKITQDVTKGEMQSAYAEGPFDKAKEALESKGYRIISLEEQAGLRVQKGANASISTRGNYVKEGVLFVPKKGFHLTRNSPIMADPVAAMEAELYGHWFYPTASQIESALADSIKIKAGEVPTNRLAEDERTAFAFGKNAKAYGEFLRANNIDRITICLENAQNKPFATPMWLSRVGCGGSSLHGDYWNFFINILEVRGVRASAKDAKPIAKNLQSGK